MDGLRDTLLALGVPGLFLIAVLDSAGVPLPGSVDLVIMLLAWQRPSRFLIPALAAAAGSTVGCLILYRLGRTGGEVALRRLDPERRKRATEKIRENDVLAILVAVLGPPPFPTKIFVLVAGVIGMPWRRFVATVFGGRLLRFSGEAYLAVRLGDDAVGTLQRHYPLIGAALVAGVALFLIAKRLRRRGASSS